MTHYEVVVYRDTAEDAAVNAMVLPEIHSRLADAVAAARTAFAEGHWTSATVHAGTMERRWLEDHWVPEFVDGERLRWYVGPDYLDREVTA